MEEMDITFLLKKNKEEKKDDNEWEPLPILNLTYYDSECTKVLATVDGKYLGFLYLIDFTKERPIDAIPCPK